MSDFTTDPERGNLARRVDTGAAIRVGIGGWTYPPWRGSFFPAGLAHRDELGFAARALTAIEINATYYRLQTPATFAGWAKAVPDGFVFTIKASRYCTNRKRLGDAGDGITRFLDQGLVELGDRLGPILWQFMATKAFDPEDFAAFLELLPRAHRGVPLRHAVQVRHPSFADPAFVALCRNHGVAIAFADGVTATPIAGLTADFVYLRLEAASLDEPLGYSVDDLDRWAGAARGWAAAATPADVFMFFINGAKVRAPDGARAMIERLSAD